MIKLTIQSPGMSPLSAPEHHAIGADLIVKPEGEAPVRYFHITCNSEQTRDNLIGKLAEQGLATRCWHQGRLEIGFNKALDGQLFAALQKACEVTDRRLPERPIDNSWTRSQTP